MSKIREILERHHEAELICDCHLHNCKTAQCPWHSIEEYVYGLEASLAEAREVLAITEKHRVGVCTLCFEPTGITGVTHMPDCRLAALLPTEEEATPDHVITGESDYMPWPDCPPKNPSPRRAMMSKLERYDCYDNDYSPDIDGEWYRVSDVDSELAALKARVEELEGELQNTEWVPFGPDGPLLCPRCDQRRAFGHFVGCSLAAALSPKGEAPCGTCKGKGVVYKMLGNDSETVGSARVSTCPDCGGGA